MWSDIFLRGSLEPFLMSSSRADYEAHQDHVIFSMYELSALWSFFFALCDKTSFSEKLYESSSIAFFRFQIYGLLCV